MSPRRPAPFVFWREGLGLAINYVAFISFFWMVYQRVSSKPTGDSSGGIDSVLFIISETVEALAFFVKDTLIRTSRLELRCLQAQTLNPELEVFLEGTLVRTWRFEIRRV